MHKGRVEAFSDGVIAIIITIMVLEFKVPHATNIESLYSLAPVFLSYILSFIYVGIYWSNHHHLFQIVKNVSGGVLWANSHLLFWLSLLPFVTAWSGENHFASVPVAAYGFVLFMCAIAYLILIKTLISNHEENSDLKVAIGKDYKGKISILLLLIGIPTAFYSSYIALASYVIVACIWIIPDKRVEKFVSN